MGTTNESESCGTDDDMFLVDAKTERMPAAMICSVSFFWEPTRWRNLFAAAYLAAQPLPKAGYYCPEVCALFPVPMGYTMEKCQLADMDECREALQANRAICNHQATCVNRKIGSHGEREPAQGALNSTGYLCRCKLGFFTVQMSPTLCHGQGMDLLFLVTERIASTFPTPNRTDVRSSSSKTLVKIASVLPTHPAVSVVHILKTARLRVLHNIQTQVAGVDKTVPTRVFAASSVFAEDSVSHENTAAGKVWRIHMRIAASFVAMTDTTLQNMATVLRTTLAEKSTWPHGGYDELQLQIQTVCSGSGCDDDTRMLDECASDAECAATDSGVCENEIAYLQVHMIESNADAVSINAQPTGFVIDAVHFDMVMRSWRLQLQFQDYQEHTRRVLLLSKTQQINGIALHVPQQERVCRADASAAGIAVHDKASIARCLQGISGSFHTLHSFADVAGNSSAAGELDLSTYADFATGNFSDLTSTTAHEWSVVDVDAEDPVLTTKTRKIVITLSYADVVRHVGTHTTRDGVMSISFDVAIASFRVRAGILSTTVAVRTIVTRIGKNFVLSNDVTDKQSNGNIVPTVSISLYSVQNRGHPLQSWGFVTFHVSLPASAVAAGVTFDHDVIPIDSVIGSIAFFSDNPVNTNPYPCIYRPDVNDYYNFAARFGCRQEIQSVSACVRRACQTRVSKSS